MDYIDQQFEAYLQELVIITSRDVTDKSTGRRGNKGDSGEHKAESLHKQLMTSTAAKGVLQDQYDILSKKFNKLQNKIANLGNTDA